jgi:hypothetical protein
MIGAATTTTVTPAKAGASGHQALRLAALGSSFRWNDEGAISLEGSVG